MDLNNSSNLANLSQDHFVAGINWLSEISAEENWNLTGEEAANLLNISLEQYLAIQGRADQDLHINLNKDTLERISLLLGIWKALQVIVPENRRDLACSLFHMANAIHVLEGKSIKQYLLDQKSTEAFYTVRRFLENICV